jgi:hypothetical protein
MIHPTLRLFIAIFVCIGCSKSAQKLSTTESKPIVASAISLPTPAKVPIIKPQDARPASVFVVQLEVWQISVPFGSVSNNAAFWKRVGEDNIDVATRDILYLNGFRVGQAPIREWDYFKNIIDENPAQAAHQSYVASEAHSVEMPLKNQVLQQCVFVMNPPQEPNGKTFDSCDNIMTLSFRPAPRKSGDVRVKLCPMIRGLHKKLEATVLNGQREFQFVAPERLYDLRLETDVPLDSFLIVAPSEYARAPMTVGNAFLIKEGETERLEQILILVPRVFNGGSPVASASIPRP